jgi:hypothetical protein
MNTSINLVLLIKVIIDEFSKMGELKFLELTGTPLETYTLNHSSNSSDG